MKVKENIEGDLSIGWATEDITPEGPVSLWGQYYERISEYVQTPLTVTALALESVNAEIREQAILISIDLVYMEGDLQESVRRNIKNQIPDFNILNLILNVTHTHSSFNPAADSKHRNMLVDKLSKVAVSAWANRQPGGISWDLQYEAIGHNRRVEYADGSTEMYGSCDRDDFIGLEGPADPAVKMLFCWDRNKKLTGIIMNVACPAQVTEAKYYVSADYWGELRKRLKEKFTDAYLLPQIGAAGDISPRDLPRGYNGDGPNMWDIPGAVDIGKRLMEVIEKAYPLAINNIRTHVPFKHMVKNIELRSRVFSKEECQRAQAIVNEILAKCPEEPKGSNTLEKIWERFLQEIKENEKIKEYGPWDNKLSDFGIFKKQEALVKHYEAQDKKRLYSVELHVLRLGDLAITTNPFEMFAEYGFRIEGRSKAKLTFLVQLSGGDYAGYLPTKRAVEGKSYRGYSAMVTHVGPEGGQSLVDNTVEVIDSIIQVSRNSHTSLSGP